MKAVSVQPGTSRRAQGEANGTPKDELKDSISLDEVPMSVSSAEKRPLRVRVSLPGREGALVTWEELAELEKTHGVETVRRWLKGGTIDIPVEEAPPKSKAFVKHMENLRRRSEQREYARMMEGVTSKGSHLSTSMTSISPEHTGVGASGFQLAAIGLNMVIGVGCAFVGADFLGRQYGLSPLQRTGVSLSAMIFVMILEMVLFIIRSSRFEKIDKQRTKSKEGVFAPAVGVNLDLSQLTELSQRANNASGDKKHD